MSSFTVNEIGSRYIVNSPDNVPLGYYPSKEDASLARAAFATDYAKAKDRCVTCDSTYFRYNYTPGIGSSDAFAVCVECGADAPPSITNAQVIDV